MTTDAIMHGKWEENYDDPSHPIPSLSAIDVLGAKKSGGADLIIVISSPLKADERSQRRLGEKIDFYLNWIKTPEYIAECGTSNAENTSIIACIHPDSDAAVFDFLSRLAPSVAERGATLRVKDLDGTQH